MPSARIIVLFTSLAFLLTAVCPAQEPTLQQSVKKQLFVFPLLFDRDARDLEPRLKHFFETELMRELVYNFPRLDFYEMPVDADVDSFLASADDFLLANALEIKQKRVDTGGRYGEAPITLDDLRGIVENGYAFVPHLTKAQWKGESWHIDATLDIFRTYDQEMVGIVTGSTESLGGLMSVSVLDVLDSVGKDDHGHPEPVSESDKVDRFQRRASGVVAELRTNLKKLDEFALKAIVTTPGINKFTFNQGADLGVELDKRYKVWSTSDPKAEGAKMLAFGKVRKIRDHESDVQVLIGGWELTYADQVIEDPRYGFDVVPVIGSLPISASGFEPFKTGEASIPGDPHDGNITLPSDDRISSLVLGAGLQMNMARLTNISELYVGGEAGLIGDLDGAIVFHFNVGVTKKYWFRRAAWLASAKYGLLLVSFTEIDNTTVDGDRVNDGVVHGLIGTTGLELLLTPDLSLTAEIGYSLLPEQTVLSDHQEDGYRARIGATGMLLRFGVLFTI